MSLFDFTFALSAVILGLALTEVAGTLHKLLRAGKRVQWAVEPVLLTAIVLLVIVSVWVEYWFARNVHSASIGQILLQVAKLMTLYIAAASCLPDVEGENKILLLNYYDRTRSLSFGALFMSLLLFRLDAIASSGFPSSFTFWIAINWFLYPVLYLALIFIRKRWFNILVLSFVIVYYGWQIHDLHLTG